MGFKDHMLLPLLPLPLLLPRLLHLLSDDDEDDDDDAGDDDDYYKLLRQSTTTHYYSRGQGNTLSCIRVFFVFSRPCDLKVDMYLRHNSVRQPVGLE